MRFPHSRSGDSRIVTRFLWFPKTARKYTENDSYIETRWLERASWMEEYRSGFGVSDSWEILFWEDGLVHE